jgi:hypothetical protein
MSDRMTSVYSAASGGDSDRRTPQPGDEAPPETPGTGENLCPSCRGSGRFQDEPCEICGGSGRITEGIGGA